jgi:hypothetical protein
MNYLYLFYNLIDKLLYKINFYFKILYRVNIPILRPPNFSPDIGILIKNYFFKNFDLNIVNRKT